MHHQVGFMKPSQGILYIHYAPLDAIHETLQYGILYIYYAPLSWIPENRPGNIVIHYASLDEIYKNHLRNTVGCTWHLWLDYYKEHTFEMTSLIESL